MLQVKTCRKCKTNKPFEDFTKNTRNKDGFSTWCRACEKLKYQENKDYLLERRNAWEEKNPDKVQAYREKFRGAYTEYRKEYYLENKEKYAERAKKYRLDDPQHHREIDKRYKETHREQINAYHREWKKNKRETSVEHVLRSNMSRRINYALTTQINGAKTKTTIEYVGCSVEYLKIYLESRFEIGMSWDNYGLCWHIDHIIPCVAWDLTNPFQSFCCWNYRNLMPLWAKENQAKKDKYDEERKSIYMFKMRETL